MQALLEFFPTRKSFESLYRAFDRWQAIQRALLARRILFQIPRVVTHKNSIGAGPDGVTEYICAARLVAGVDPGAVKRARQVYHCITRTHWDRDAI